MANILRKGNRTQAVATTHRTDVTIAKNASQKPKHVAFHPWENAQAWVESITKEESRRKQWEQMYGWMGDFDFKGNMKTQKRSLENSICLSNKVPNSHGHDYGWYIKSELGQEINTLQTRFYYQYKKRLPAKVLDYH